MRRYPAKRGTSRRGSRVEDGPRCVTGSRSPRRSRQAITSASCRASSVDVAEDPIAEREEAVARGTDQVDECRLVATLRRLDEIPVASHRSLPLMTFVENVVGQSR